MRTEHIDKSSYQKIRLLETEGARRKELDVAAGERGLGLGLGLGPVDVVRVRVG